ncbi:MAG TPA: hypothetical protein VGL22_13325 [Terracidiphilus sp.]
MTRQLASAPNSDARNLLAVEWAEVNRRVREFLTEARAQRLSELQANLQDVLAGGRAALDKWKDCDTEARTAQGRLNAYFDTLGRARVELMQVEGERPDREQWPTAEELAEYDQRLSRAQDRARRAERHHSDLTDVFARAEAAATNAARALEALREQRDQLQAQIDGKPYRGPFGLTVPAGGV